MQFLKVINLIVVMALLSSCAKHYPAPVNDVNQERVIKSSQPMSKQKKFKPKYTTVKKGDTLYSIGFSRSIDYKYLAKINGIKPPYNIYPGQKLRLQANNSLVNNAPSVVSNASKASTHAVKLQQPSFKPITVTKPLPKPKVVKKIPSKPLIKAKNKPPTPVKKSNKITVIQPVAKSNSHWQWPLKGRILSTFLASDIARKGIDIAAQPNTPVLASQNGTVVYSGDGLRGYGELIIIKHSNNLLSAYAHNSSRLVKEGEAVKQGQIIAKSGKGTDGQSLLHFEIRKNGQPVNPLKYLPK